MASSSANLSVVDTAFGAAASDPVAYAAAARTARDAALRPSALKGRRVLRVSSCAPHHRASFMEFLPPLARIAFGVSATGGMGCVTPPPLPAMPRWIAPGCIASACGPYNTAPWVVPAPPLGRAWPRLLRSSAGQLLRILCGAVSSRSL
ncbi:hypothetical protein ABFU84_02070 [Xanthomonas translucens pv. undulosa]|uniref:hypothetical protein n=1 Tax=Xanthomonas campestris pv. translucens TaxID=343 RepID=UPI003CF4C9DB